MIYDFGIFGGDMRQIYIAQILKSKGYSVITYSLCTHKPSGCAEAGSFKSLIDNSRCLIGPIALSESSGKISAKKAAEDLTLGTLEEHLKGQKIFAGCISAGFEEWCRERESYCYDFMKNRELAMYNAIATAEGTILEAIYHSPGNLHGSNVLILGYGTCAKVLANKLKGLDTNIMVCARADSQRMEAGAFGYAAIGFDRLSEHIGSMEYIFNTVPAIVLDRDKLALIESDALVIDIASMPGGVDREAASELGINLHHCLGLPGKYAPRASALFLADTVLANTEKESNG